MTRNSDFKQLVRARMGQTGENYTAARAALLAERATDPRGELISPPAAPRAEPDPVAARVQHERLIRSFLREGRLVQIPSRRRARFSVMLELLARFAPGEVYSEAEVGEILGVLHDDVAYLRRELVDYGLLERDGLGAYWVTRTMPARTGTMTQEITDWEQVWLPRFLASA